jgi:hypothetical protein
MSIVIAKAYHDSPGTSPALPTPSRLPWSEETPWHLPSVATRPERVIDRVTVNDQNQRRPSDRPAHARSSLFHRPLHLHGSLTTATNHLSTRKTVQTTGAISRSAVLVTGSKTKVHVQRGNGNIRSRFSHQIAHIVPPDVENNNPLVE